MPRFAFLLLASVFAPLAAAQGFAALTVLPAGEQTFDLATGVVTLPEGGAVVDATRGVRLESPFIRYQDGRFIETAAAVVTGEFGTLRAERVYVDLEAEELRASGALELSRDGMRLTARDLLLDLEAGVARLQGEVTSSLPAFEAEQLVMRLDDASVLLVAPYRYANGPLVLKQEAPGSLLQLTREERAEGELAYSPSTSIQQDVLASLGPYLPQ